MIRSTEVLELVRLKPVRVLENLPVTPGPLTETAPVQISAISQEQERDSCEEQLLDSGGRRDGIDPDACAFQT